MPSRYKTFNLNFWEEIQCETIASRRLPHGNTDSGLQHNERIFREDHCDSNNVQHGLYSIVWCPYNRWRRNKKLGHRKPFHRIVCWDKKFELIAFAKQFSSSFLCQESFLFIILKIPAKMVMFCFMSKVVTVSMVNDACTRWQCGRTIYGHETKILFVQSKH